VLVAFKEQQAAFYQSVAALSGSDANERFITLTTVEEHADFYEESSEWLPLAVWGQRGFDTTLLQHKCNPEDRRPPRDIRRGVPCAHHEIWQARRKESGEDRRAEVYGRILVVRGAGEGAAVRQRPERELVVVQLVHFPQEAEVEEAQEDQEAQEALQPQRQTGSR